MSEPKQNLHGSITAGTQKPAIGLFATSDNGDAIAGAILRSQNNGHQVIVTAPDRGVEGLEHADRLGANIVDPEAHTNGFEPGEKIARAARDAGYPGLIYQEHTANRIDFNKSTAKLLDSSEYRTTAVSKEPVQETKVIAGIPTYNEEVGIGSIVLQCQKYCDEVIVIDDGSSDNTVDVAADAGALVLEHDTNKGKGAALKTLLDFVEGKQFEALVLLDGDGQHTPSDIPTVLNPVVEGTIFHMKLASRAHSVPF